MRLSLTLTLSYLSFSASAQINSQPETKPAISSATRRRMLQKIEKRIFQGNSGGNGKGRVNDGAGNTSTSGGSRAKNGNGLGRGGIPKAKGKGKGGNKEHSAHLDKNDNGITLDAIEYEYSTPVHVEMELTNDLVPYEVLMGLNLEEMPNWTMGIFMRMADPQGGVLPPIVSVSPEFWDAPTRKLQETQLVEGEATSTKTSTPPMMGPDESLEPPTLNFMGKATFKNTDATTLDSNRFGTGFDIYLLDENGAAIIGPATFYTLKTEEMKAAEVEASNKKSNHPLAKYNHARKKQPKGQGGYGQGGYKGSRGMILDKVQGGKPDAKGQGYGSGANGGMIIGTAESLATYILESDKLDYVMGEDVIVTYDLSPVSSEGRKLQGNSGKNGNGGNGKGNGKGNGNNQQSTTTQATTSNVATTTEATTTSSEATTTPDMSPDDEINMTYTQEIDNTDITLYSMGIYMRMAHPQGGQLPPIHKMEFCPNGPDYCPTADELEMGQFTFSTNVLDLGEYGGGYDVWILNGSGGGIAGPFTLYVTEASGE